MNEIWDRTLCLPNLPKKLISRRNLHAHFSKFGEVKDISVNKDNRTGLIEFASRAEAKAAKNLGKVYVGKPLRILWCENTLKTTEKTLDPRAREQEDMIEVDNLWEDDDKECFGVKTKTLISDDNKISVKDMLGQHLKLQSVKKRLINKTSALDLSEEPESKSYSIKTSKTQLKKPQTNKRKLLRKDGLTSDKIKKKTLVVKELSYPTGASSDQVDLKQKLALLDERDKMIRQKTVQDSNIKTAVAIKGTCADMCPERERILRQCGHQIAVYESFPGTNAMDENKAVKEYIRSSADQEVPLPHDLRPGPVLSMTMTYLITNIINQIDDPNENKAVWYSFCWNRLRSIRKDIILQQLCDLETVTIVEQCARFHICCYDHMWGIEVSGYSDKINTNNLIDCLQTLKHLYEDLAKRNITCPNEPEFHSYLILLKLTTGDVFWEYQQYAPKIQFSPKVQFAIAVYMAFINNMYSKYFSLVKQASYLEACLLQRHFDEVRTRALKMMLKAYSPPSRNVNLTTYFLVECLKFDSRKNVLRFYEKVEGHLEKKIEFDEEENEDENILTSSYLIRNKRLPIANAVVGENNPLPVYIPHKVHTSFDEDGKLREPLKYVPDGDDDENDYNDSYDTPQDESDISIPEVKPQPSSLNKPFKFSLSPKVTEEKSHTPNVFQRVGPVNSIQSCIIKNELPEINSTDLYRNLNVSAKGIFKVENSFCLDKNNDSNKKIKDFDEEIIHDDGYDESEEGIVSEKITFFTQFGPDEGNYSALKQSMQSAPTSPLIFTSNKFFKQEKNNQSSNPFLPSNCPKLKSNIDFQVSLTPKLDLKTEPAKQSSFKIDNSNISQCENFFQQSSSNGKNKTVDHFSQGKNEINATINIDMNSPQALTNVKSLEKSAKIKNEAEEKEKRILEKMLSDKAEEERKKMEEIKRDELEKQKNIEKQRALDKLRKDLRERMKAKNARKCLRTWKARVESLKKKRADFPFLHQLSVKGHIELWGGLKCVPTTSVFQRAKDRQNLVTIVSNVLKNGINDTCKYIGLDLAESLAEFAAKTMNMGSIRPIYWKLAVSLPWKDRTNSKYSVFNKMMSRCYKQAFYKNPEAHLGSVESTMTSQQIPVYVSVHVSDDLQSCNDLHGMDALIFVVVDGFESEKICLDRLRNLVTSHSKNTEFSVAVMTINGNRFDSALKKELEELQEKNLIAFWTLSAWTNSNCLLETLTYLANHVSVVQDVCAKSLESLVREATEDFIYDVDRSQVYSSALTDALKSPNTALNIYNTFLTKLENILLSGKLEKYLNFSEEFKSHIPPNYCGGPELMCGKLYNNQYKAIISNKINSLKLPEIQGWPVYTDKVDFDSLAELLESYCRTKIDDIEVFKQTIRKLAQDVGDSSSYLNSLSWLHIVEMWAESRINHVFSMKEKDEKMFVVYSKNDLQCMIKKQWWITLPFLQTGNI